ncbi:MAG: hypothetical protein AB7M12_03995 [Hyphomonadaceae bacterium]
MRHRLFALALLALGPALAGAPALAASAKEEKETGGERVIVAPNVVTPVIRDGKLVNYLFVTVQVDLADGANSLKLRDRAHFLRDSLLRATHRVSLASPDRNDTLNTQAALPVLKAAAEEALGAANIKKVSITGVDSLRRS